MIYIDKIGYILNDVNSKFQFQSKVMMKNLLKITNKRIVCKLSEISIPKSYSANWRLEWRLCQNCTSQSFYNLCEISHQRTLRSRRVGLGRLIVLNDSASPQMVLKINSNFLWFFCNGFRVVWMSSHIWLLIGTSFASLTRQNY